ncbi:LysM peptidoglycan-binding domain-containing protein [Marinimicrobium alkaliphilum]|uniref:LysM peptidoglycan-binding domain-containing protein n=1 Tax=Marinimicrobium alkaliphilum TaxID=2202654 RepID=UPI000DBAB887|nr:LysM peptidoglycan-binding domain-containing protein [Marinimicrobium alkaliphilum]
MKKLIFAVLAASMLSVLAWADRDTAFRSDHPEEYVVERGDTLWDISNKFLNTPWLWPEIWHVNPQIENPHLIFPGDLIRLVYIDGQPRLTVERTVRMAPGDTRLQPSIRVLSEEDAIPAIPLDRIDSYLSRSRILTEGELDNAPYMLAGPERRLIVGMGDRAYARGDLSEDVDTYGVFRKGEVYHDPQTRERLGEHAQAIGTVRVRTRTDDVATVTVSRSYEEIRMGDRLLPSEQRPVESVFYPSAPDDDIVGQILAVEGGVSQIGKFDVVMINRGEREGLQVGNVLATYKRGEQVRDRVTNERVNLPDERAGLVMIFRTFEKMSFGLVLEADRPLAVEDRVRNP